MALTPGPGVAGESGSSVVTSANAVSLSTGTAKSVTTLALQPGVWYVRGTIDFQFGASTSYTQLQGGISTTADTLGSQDQNFAWCAPATVPTAALDISHPVPTQVVTVRTATTFQLVAKATFTVSTLKAYGTLSAVRIR